MSQKRKLELGIVAFICTFIGDYLLGITGTANMIAGGMFTQFIGIANWRLTISSLLGTIAVPLYAVAVREFIKIIKKCNPRGENKTADRFIEVFKLSNYAGIISFVCIHVVCCSWVQIYNTCYEMTGVITNADQMLIQNMTITGIPVVGYLFVADIGVSLAWMVLIGRGWIPLSKVWMLCNPLVFAVIGQTTALIPLSFVGLDSGFESLGWILLFCGGMKLIQKTEK